MGRKARYLSAVILLFSAGGLANPAPQNRAEMPGAGRPPPFKGTQSPGNSKADGKMNNAGIASSTAPDGSKGFSTTSSSTGDEVAIVVDPSGGFQEISFVKAGKESIKIVEQRAENGLLSWRITNDNGFFATLTQIASEKSDFVLNFVDRSRSCSLKIEAKKGVITMINPATNKTESKAVFDNNGTITTSSEDGRESKTRAPFTLDELIDFFYANRSEV